MKYKIIGSEYMKYYNTSTVLISTPLGYFEGWAFLNPEDKEYESEFTGCEIAEARAVIQYIKAEIHNLKIEIKTLKDMEKIFASLKDFCPKSREFCQLRKQIHIKEVKLQNLKDRIKNLEHTIEEIPKLKKERVDRIQRQKAEIFKKFQKKSN